MDTTIRSAKRRLAWVLALALAVTACGGDDPATTTVGSSMGDSQSASGNGAATTPDSVDGSDDSETGSLATATVAFASQVVSLDPDQALDTPSLAAVHLIAGTLFELGPDGAAEPSLAASATQSDDAMSWTIVLRDGLVFSDGSPLTSADVKATLERAKSDPANLYPGLVGPIERIDAPTPTEVVIQLNRPYPSLPTVMVQPAMMIMPEALLGEPGFFDAPISAGPYALAEWGGTDTARFVRNQSYSGPAPVIDELRFVTIDDANTRLAQVGSGQIQLAADLPPNLLPDLDSGDVSGALVDLFGFVSIVPNNTRAPFDDPRVRRAISLAVDREQIADVAWGGAVTPLAGFWAPGYAGFDESIATERDVEAAVALLEGTACESGCSTTLTFSSGVGWTDQTAAVLQQNLADIGIEVTLDKGESTVVLDRTVNGDFDMIVTYLYDYSPIPDGMLAYGLVSDGGLAANFSLYASSEMDTAAAAAVQADDSSRPGALAEIERLFAQDQPYVNLSTYGLVFASNLPSDVIALDSSGFVRVGRAS